MKKIIIIPFLLLLIFSGIGLVFGSFINFDKTVSFIDSSAQNIITSSDELNSSIVRFESSINIEDAQIYSYCNISTDFLGHSENMYYFEMTLKDDLCENPYFNIKLGDENFSSSSFKINIENDKEIYELLIDYDDTTLANLRKSLIVKKDSYAQYMNISSNSIQGDNQFAIIKKQRAYSEMLYKEKIVTHIINRRNHKYSVPVQGYDIATGLNVIPNAARPYRSDYTDGIHHGWDIMAPKGTQVSAIDDGIVVRVVKDFAYADISKIKKGASLTLSQKLRNLDILRGNQVWLKTMKGDVIFYSHLDEVYEDIVEGKILTVGEGIGKIGSTGVPDKDYTNFHLHFPIQKNPYDHAKAGTYSMEDYMAWDWYLKGLDPTAVIEGQDDIFITEVHHQHEEE